MLSDGTVEQAVDEASVVTAVEKALAKGVDGIVISLLNAYRNPAHEAQVAAIAARVAPQLFVFRSSEVWPIIREYERTTTALINGYVHPKVSDYLEKLIEGLESRGVTAEPLITKSNGGIMRAELGKRACVSMVLSGTASGVMGAAWVAREAGHPNVITPRHRRHQRRRRPDHRRPAAVRPGREDRRPAALHPERGRLVDRRRRRIDRLGRRLRRAQGRAGERRLRAGTGLLRPRRHPAHHHRRLRGLRLLRPARSRLRRVPPRRGTGAGRHRHAGRAASISGSSRPRRRSSASPSPACSSRSTSSSPATASTRATSPSCRSAAPARCWAASWPASSACSASLIPSRPGVVSALGGLVANVKNDFIRTLFIMAADGDAARLRDAAKTLQADGTAWLRDDQEFTGEAAYAWFADMRYRGQSFEIEVPLASSLDRGGRHGGDRRGVPSRPRRHLRFLRSRLGRADHEPAPRRLGRLAQTLPSSSGDAPRAKRPSRSRR